MKRKPHYLQMVAQGAWPAKIVVGHASISREALNGTGRIAIDKLVSYHLVEIRLSADKFHGATERIGNDASRLLCDLGTFLVRKKTTLVYLSSAYRVLTAAGLWDAIEAGDWNVCEQAESDAAANGKGKSKGWNGTIVVSPRCTIICIRKTRCPGTLRIVDTANFGLDIRNDPATFVQEFRRVFYWSLQWHDLLASEKFGAPQNTVASQAMRAFRSQYLDTPLLVHDNMAALRLERQSVHAGRCECFALGVMPGEVYHLDSSSHYAGVTIGQDIPCRLRSFTSPWNNNCKPSERPLERMIADVTIDTPDAFYPVAHNGDIVYPVGVFRTTLCGPELVLANTEGHLQQIHSAAIYDMDRPFDKFYMALWKAREKSVKDQSKDLGKTIKALLSRFHGKFCQTAVSWIPVPNYLAPDCFAQWYADSPDNLDTLCDSRSIQVEPWHAAAYNSQRFVKWRSIGWQTQVEVNAGEHRNACPAIASWILSLGRVRLLQWMLSAGNNNVHYMDTDSLWTNRTGYLRLLADGHVRDGSLGYLRLIATHKRMHIGGLKTYTVDGEATHGGIPDEATMQANGSYRYYIQTGVESAIRNRHLPTAASFLVERKTGTKYRHGTPTLSGRVMPLTGPFDLEARNVNSHRISCTCRKCKPYGRTAFDLH